MPYQGKFDVHGEDDDGPMYIYYNANIVSQKTSISENIEAPQPVRFSETRDVPILKNISKYSFSIVRFQLNGPNTWLPILIPRIRIGAANPTQDVNLTIYSVTLSADVQLESGGNTLTTTVQATQPLIWRPENLDPKMAPVPSASTTQTSQQVNTHYYYCYTISHWLSIVNQAYKDCMAQLQVKVDAAWTAAAYPGVAPTLQTQPPYMTYDPSLNLFRLYCDRYGFGGADSTSYASTTAKEQYTLYFNNNMYGLFANFQGYTVNLPDSEADYQVTVGSVLYQNLLQVSAGTPTPTKTTTYWVMAQDFPSTSTLWSPIDGIVFTTSLMPIVYEQSSEPVVFSDGNSNTIAGSKPYYECVLTDISLPLDNCFDYRQLISYFPSAEYRMASFQNSKSTLNQISVDVFWRNRLDGGLYPIQLFNGSSVNIKMMFRRNDVPAK